MVASSSTTSTRGRPAATAALRAGGAAGRTAAARPLALEPGVDVALPEPPLAAYPNRRNLARLDQAVDRPEIDLQVLEYLFGRQEAFIDHGR